jgi:hypothetical protein
MKKSEPAAPPPNVVIDEQWYLSQYPDVVPEIRPGRFRSARDHFIKNGYREGRLPTDPRVDEAWYLTTYPDVAEAIRSGDFKNAYHHFVEHGYAEGRKPNKKAR